MPIFLLEAPIIKITVVSTSAWHAGSPCSIPAHISQVYLVLNLGSQHWDYVSLMNHRIMLTATHLKLGRKRTTEDD